MQIVTAVFFLKAVDLLVITQFFNQVENELKKVQFIDYEICVAIPAHG
jgi:hypothetical protein